MYSANIENTRSDGSKSEKYDMYAGRYFGAIVRLNSLPSRFLYRHERKIEEKHHCYLMFQGRDERETVFLFPDEEADIQLCEDIICKHIESEKKKTDYITTVVVRESVDISSADNYIKRMYHVLDSFLVPGKSQRFIFESLNIKNKEQGNGYEYLDKLEELARNNEIDSLCVEVYHLIKKWGEEMKTQIWMENNVRQICSLVQRYDLALIDCQEMEFRLDAAFYEMRDINQLLISLDDILFKNMLESECHNTQRTCSDSFFIRIKAYMQEHMTEDLSLTVVSDVMGCSKSYLSKMFRKYENTTFSNYLTSLRMEEAKKLFSGEERLLVKEVAGRVGYKNQFYFSQVFLTYTGIRPQDYGK